MREYDYPRTFVAHQLSWESVGHQKRLPFKCYYKELKLRKVPIILYYKRQEKW